MSIVYRSVKGSKLTSDEVDGNFRYLDSSINPDRIISLGTETIVGNEYTYEGYTWQLGGVQINNIGNPIQIVLPSATTGFKRNDISVFKANGTIERIAGIETDGEIVSTPDVPEGTLYFKTYFIDGNVVESEPEPPVIDGSIFKKKSENSSLKITATGEEQIINLSLGGQMHYIVTSTALISVAGFSPHLLNMGGNPLYPGQDLIFENQTGNPVTLINAHTIAPIKFNEGADIIVPNGGKIWFRINEEFAKIIMKSWSDIDLSTKADLVAGKVPSSQLPSYVDDVLEFANLAAFPATGESGKIYVALDTNLQYRWSGSAYMQIGGGKSQQIRAFYPSWNFNALNTWRSWNRNTSNMLVSDVNQSLGTGVIPSSFVDSNFILITNATKLKKVYWSLRDPASSGMPTIEIYIKSFTFNNGVGRGSERNNQVLIQESWNLPGVSVNGYKDDFTIAAHTLDAITGIQIAYRQTTGTIGVPIQGVQLILEFE